MDVTANLVSSAQLDAWMQVAVQRTLATADEWCFAVSQVLGIPQCNGGDPSGGLGTQVLTCAGMNGDGSNRTTLSQISSIQFLSCLRNYQLQQNATNPAPGGSLTTPGTSTTGGAGNPPPVTNNNPPPNNTQGQGVLGLTNCTVCQQLASNPLMLLILAVAAWYLFFK